MKKMTIMILALFILFTACIKNDNKKTTEEEKLNTALNDIIELDSRPVKNSSDILNGIYFYQYSDYSFYSINKLKTVIENSEEITALVQVLNSSDKESSYLVYNGEAVKYSDYSSAEDFNSDLAVGAITVFTENTVVYNVESGDSIYLDGTVYMDLFQNVELSNFTKVFGMGYEFDIKVVLKDGYSADSLKIDGCSSDLAISSNEASKRILMSFEQYDLGETEISAYSGDEFLSKIKVQIVKEESENVDSLNVYYIGNSITDMIKYEKLQEMAEARGYENNWGRHMIPGAPLSWLWDHRTEGFKEAPYGYPENALPNYHWDAVTLEPFDRLLDSDVEYIGNYINLTIENSPAVQFYIYSRWPRKPEEGELTAAKWAELWDRRYTGGWDGTNESRDYFETLLNACREEYTGIKQFLMIPVGDVLYELNSRMAVGEIDGFSSVWDLYADNIHFNDNGSYVAATTFFAVMYKDDPRGLIYENYNVSKEFAEAVQEVVLEIVTNHSYTDLSGQELLILSSAQLDEAYIGEEYSTKILATGGSFDYTWTVTAGTLPTGLILNSQTGEISGTASEEGTYSFTLTLDDQKNSVSREFQIQVNAEPEPDPDAKLIFGTNLGGPADWGAEWPFNNIMKFSRQWLTGNSYWVDGGKNEFDTGYSKDIACDENGYPLELPYDIEGAEAPQVFFTVWANTEGMLAGDYTLLYDGEGDIEFAFDANVISSEPGKMIVHLEYNNDIASMRITRSVKGNHIRNIRLLLPGSDENEIFNRYWKEKLTVFKTLRFMDWGSTNHNPMSSWDERTLVDNYSYTNGKGIPYELMIEASNQLDKNMWICVPHMADDDFIRNLATLIHDNLDPELKVYVEYSNEIWNWMFTQASYCNENGDQSVVWPERVVPFIQNTMDIFSDVFSDDMDRLVRVVGVQHSWIDVSNRIASNMRAGSFDMLSPAAYFGITSEGYDELEAAGESATVDLVLECAKKSIDEDSWPWMLGQKEIADRLGVGMVFYEGGQHLTPRPFGSEQPYNQALVDVQSSEGMYELYDYWFDLLRSLNNNPEFVNFSLAGPKSGRYGSWGIFESIFDEGPYSETAPKYQAIVDNIE